MLQAVPEGGPSVFQQHVALGAGKAALVLQHTAERMHHLAQLHPPLLPTGGQVLGMLLQAGCTGG